MKRRAMQRDRPQRVVQAASLAQQLSSQFSVETVVRSRVVASLPRASRPWST